MPSNCVPSQNCIDTTKTSNVLYLIKFVHEHGFH